ncbi:hypothetical protein HMPREF0322_00267 [Desulfitobacterium hafniense DP7]|uniref:Uncharacterized protein n=1 Tax=Desulfitobacterium hafniense DP7 TaxID=537010 RepID=G9XH45_DESHA|nr:hypothetical protein HMPREF0322_00267 [Desulfitobacterium hafniense DP7]
MGEMPYLVPPELNNLVILSCYLGNEHDESTLFKVYFVTAEL